MSINSIGRANAIKNGLITKIRKAIPTATVIDDYRLKTFQFSSFNGILVSVKCSNFRDTPLNYGMKSIMKRHGTWITCNFGLTIFARLTDGELESSTAYQAVNIIKRYIEEHEVDDESGIIEIYNTTVREIMPKKGVHMATLLMEGELLAQRPYKQL